MTGIFPPRSRSLLAGSQPVHQQQFVGGHEYSHAADTPPLVNSKSATSPRSRLPKQLHSIREHPGLESFPSTTQERPHQATNSSLTSNQLPPVPISSPAGDNVRTGERPAFDTPNGASIAAVAAIQQRSGPSNIGHVAAAAATTDSRFSAHGSEGESSVPSSTNRGNPGLDQVPSQLRFRPSNIVQSHGQNGSHVHRASSRASTTIGSGVSLNSKTYPVVTTDSSIITTSNKNSNTSSNNTETSTHGRNRRLRSEEEVSGFAPGSNPSKSKMLASPHVASASTTSSPAKKAPQQLHLTDIPFATRSFANDPCVGTFCLQANSIPDHFSITASFFVLTSPSRAL